MTRAAHTVTATSGRDPAGPHATVRVITVDGPSGSGKSTAARGVAARLGWRYVDTGATYRAATLAVLRRGVDPQDAERVHQVVSALLARDGLRLSTDPAQQLVELDGTDVREEIRAAAVTGAVSAVSAVPEVRVLLVALQRRLLGEDGAVGEGRDVGTAVVPDAALKVFLDASPEVRAARRAADADAGIAPAPGLALSGGDAIDAVAADLARRDLADSTRVSSPLRAADDAVHLPSDELTPEQVVDHVLELARRAGLA